jgi:hypothetical protein
MLRKHRDGILAAIRLDLSNGRLKGLDSKIRLITPAPSASTPSAPHRPRLSLLRRRAINSSAAASSPAHPTGHRPRRSRPSDRLPLWRQSGAPHALSPFIRASGRADFFIAGRSPIEPTVAHAPAPSKESPIQACEPYRRALPDERTCTADWSPCRRIGGRSRHAFRNRYWLIVLQQRGRAGCGPPSSPGLPRTGRTRGGSPSRQRPFQSRCLGTRCR